MTHDLGRQQHAEHPAGDLDAGQAQHGDQRPGAERPGPPRRVPVQVGGGVGGGGRAQRPVEADLQERVGQQRDECGSHSSGAAQATGDQCIKGTRVGHVTGHGHVTGREDRQDHRDDQERGRDAG